MAIVLVICALCVVGAIYLIKRTTRMIQRAEGSHIRARGQSGTVFTKAS